MQVNTRLFTAVELALALTLSACSPPATDPHIDPVALSNVSGLPGTYDEVTNVYRVEISRAALEVSVRNIKLPPGMGLDSWATFTGTKKHAILIGEVRLLEDEVNGFLKSAVNTGIEITSLHNTFMGDQPRVMSLHFEALGPEEVLARESGALLKGLTTRDLPRDPPSTEAVNTFKKDLNLDVINRLLWKGDWKNGAYRLTTGRGTAIAGQAVGKSMGVESWAAFAGSDDHAIVNGDIAVLDRELKKVIRELLEANIRIVSIHAHLTNETPRVLFVHYFGVGKLEGLAQGVKNALKTEKNFRGST